MRERADFYDLKDARNKPLLAEEHAFQELMRRKHFVDCRKKRHHAFQAPGTVLKPDLAWREYLESTNILYLSIHSWCWQTFCSQFSMLDLAFIYLFILDVDKHSQFSMLELYCTACTVHYHVLTKTRRRESGTTLPRRVRASTEYSTFLLHLKN